MKKFLTICAVVFITAGNMWADTHYVDPEGSNTHPYTTPATAAHSIQDAINAAISGDFINVVNGTYVLSSTINVDKSLTLTGESEAGVQIDASGNGTGYGIKIEADNVTMQYFTILPPIVSGSVGTSGGGGYAIHASFNHTAPYSKYNNLALDHITVNNGNRTAFDIHGYHGVTLDDLTATGAAYGNGISLTGCSNGVVTNCTTSSNAWGGIAVYVSKPAYLGTGSDNITIDFSTNTIGEWIYVEDEYSLVNTNINILTWTYAINNDYSATANYTAYINTTLADALFFGAVLNLKFLNMQSVVYDLAGDTYYVGPGMSIQRAIDVASAGDDIIVAAGTYAGFIVATANIELRGAQYNNDPAGATTRGAAGDGDESVITGTITITADNVTVNGFKTGYSINVGYDHAHYVNISYNISENANGQYGAIHLHGPPYNQCDWAYIGFNTISGTTSPDWQGGGIWTVGNDDIIIEHNHILNSQYMGIFAPNHVGDRNIIRYNTITNSGHTPIRFWGGSQADISYNVIDGGGMDGIWVDQAADNSTVSYNQISNVTYATVTLRGGATGVNVLHNTITTSEKGVEIRGSGNTICNNQIFNTTYEGIQAFASATITGNEVYGCYHGVQLRGNATSYTVTLNNIHDNTYNGIEIPNYSGEVVSSATIEDNILANNSWCGVKVGGNTDGSGYHINSNGITGNGIYGVESLTTADVDAEENYWGDASGSSGAGPGAGDAVSPNVDFCY
jgi:parallel beta-helix repeat protein